MKITKEIYYEAAKKYKYDKETNNLFNRFNNVITNDRIKFKYNDKKYNLNKETLINYIKTGEVNFKKIGNLSKINRPLIEDSPKPTTKQFNTKKYIQKIELEYELILSLGKGKLTKKAESMLISIATNLSKRFFYKNPEDRNDCISGAILELLLKWKNYNSIKHNDPFAYFTEIAKRAMAKEFNDCNGIKQSTTKDRYIQVVSLNNFRL